MSLITVDSCMECPFVVYTRENGFCGCTVPKTEVWVKENEELPRDKVHEKCPLKSSDILVKYTN